MSTADNKAAFRRLFDGLNHNDLTIVDELCTPDFVLHDPGSPIPTGGIHSSQDYKNYLSGFLTSLPGQFTIDDMIAEGDKVVARWTYRSTHQGQWRGVSPTGKGVTFTCTSTSRFVNGKIAENWQNVDNLGVMRQLGLIPA
jgi:predicted ester cyclase